MPRTLGVEEEFHLVDLKTRRLTARAPELLDELSDTYVAELQRCVIEMNSGVVDSLEGLRADLRGHREVLVDAATRLGIGVVAAGAVPFSVPAEMQVTQTPRYRQMLADYQLLAREQLICGTQVHVGIDDRDESVVVANRVAPYRADAAGAERQLAVLGGRLRHRLFQRTHPGVAALADDGARSAGFVGGRVRQLVADLVGSGVIADGDGLLRRPAGGRDADPGVTGVRQLPVGRHHRVDRRACFGHWSNARSSGFVPVMPAFEVSPPMGRAALWRAARSGLEGDLVDVDGPREPTRSRCRLRPGAVAAPATRGGG